MSVIKEEAAANLQSAIDGVKKLEISVHGISSKMSGRKAVQLLKIDGFIALVEAARISVGDFPYERRQTRTLEKLRRIRAQVEAEEDPATVLARLKAIEDGNDAEVDGAEELTKDFVDLLEKKEDGENARIETERLENLLKQTEKQVEQSKNMVKTIYQSEDMASTSIDSRLDP